jgi:hypothetical protein
MKPGAWQLAAADSQQRRAPILTQKTRGPGGVCGGGAAGDDTTSTSGVRSPEERLPREVQISRTSRLQCWALGAASTAGRKTQIHAGQKHFKTPHAQRTASSESPRATQYHTAHTTQHTGKLLTGNTGSLCEQQPLKALRAPCGPVPQYKMLYYTAHSTQGAAPRPWGRGLPPPPRPQATTD